jgi:endo-1,4-beta-D-glucanase Y
LGNPWLAWSSFLRGEESWQRRDYKVISTSNANHLLNRPIRCGTTGNSPTLRASILFHVKQNSAWRSPVSRNEEENNAAYQSSEQQPVPDLDLPAALFAI